MIIVAEHAPSQMSFMVLPNSKSLQNYDRTFLVLESVKSGQPVPRHDEPRHTFVRPYLISYLQSDSKISNKLRVRSSKIPITRVLTATPLTAHIKYTTVPGPNNEMGLFLGFGAK